MSEIRILSAGDFDALVQVFADAYPGLKIVSSEDRLRFKQRALKLHEEQPTAHFHGLWACTLANLVPASARLSMQGDVFLQYP